MFPVIDCHLMILEIFLSLIFVGLVITDILLPKNTPKDWLGISSQIALAALTLFWLTQKDCAGITANGMFVMDSMAWFFKGFFLLTMIFVVAMAQEFFSALGTKRNAFYLLLWLTLIGLCLIASSADFLLLFMGIEILTISLYVMTAYLKSDALSLEAGMKYLILGALASGFFLYGISFLYGATHSTSFTSIHNFCQIHAMTPMTLFALTLILAAVGFKIAAVPFGWWVPDVYQGAPTPVTALLSVGSKAAGFLVFIRLFLGVFGAWHPQWHTVFAVLAALSMSYGNLLAMSQTNIKRLLGYSSIAHAGYLLMGAVAGTALGVWGVNFYLLGYLFTNLGAFLVIIVFSKTVPGDKIEDYTGLSKRSSLLAATLLLALVSLAGMPPLVGFFGKFLLLMAVIKSGYLWLAGIAAVNIVIALYYYLKIARCLYTDTPKSVTPILVPTGLRLLMILSIAGMLLIGIFQGPFLDSVIRSVQSLSLPHA